MKRVSLYAGVILCLLTGLTFAGCSPAADLPATLDPSFAESMVIETENSGEDMTFVESESSLDEIVETVIEPVTTDAEPETEETTAETTVAETTEESTKEAKVEESQKETTNAAVNETTVVQTTEAEKERTTEEETTEEPTTEIPTTEAPTTAAPVPQSLSAKVKGDFYIGDTLSAGDFSITVTMSDGSTKKNPAGWSADQLYLGGSQTVITVSYQGITTSITVNAVERPTVAPTEKETDPPVVEPVQPSMTLDRSSAEAAWNIQKGIIESQAFNLDTMDYTGYPIQWSERLYQLACQRAKEIVDNFSHDGFASIDASAENIAKNVPYAEMVIDGWYNSAGHKKNMLGGWDYGAIARYGNYWVALFSNTP